MRIAVIPARGGSKRIPGKNIRPFAGKPMIAYSIECALAAGLFDRVVLSTDDPAIRDIGVRCGAEAPFLRPAALADDYSGTGAVVAHATAFLAERGEPVEAICCIYATAPFLRATDLCAGYDLFATGAWDYVFAATSYDAPVFRGFRRRAGGGLQMLFPEHFPTRSQDLPPVLHDAGQFYWGKPEAWLEQRRVFDAASTVVEIPRWRVQDIDTEDDWIRAEAMAPYIRARD